MNLLRNGFACLLVGLSLSIVLTGCSVFISTPHETRFQIQGEDDQLREYVVRLDNPVEEGLGIQLSDRYSLQFDFEWLWNSDENADIYYEMSGENAESAMTPWMLCKYRF